MESYLFSARVAHLTSQYDTAPSEDGEKTKEQKDNKQMRMPTQLPPVCSLGTGTHSHHPQSLMDHSTFFSCGARPACR